MYTIFQQFHDRTCFAGNPGANRLKMPKSKEFVSTSSESGSDSDSEVQ